MARAPDWTSGRSDVRRRGRPGAGTEQDVLGLLVGVGLPRGNRVSEQGEVRPAWATRLAGQGRMAREMPAGGKPDDTYSRRSVAPPCRNLGSHSIEGCRVPRVQRTPERSSNRSAREARPPALLLPRSVFAADHPAPEYCRIRDEDPLTVRHVRRLRDGNPGAEYLSQGAVGGPRAVLAGQEIMHGRVAEQPDAGRHFHRRGVLGAHVGEQRHESPKVCFLLCQSLAARSGGCVVRGMGVPGAAWCLPGHLVPAFCAGGNRGEGPPETGAKVPWQGRERCLTLGITSREANLEARRRGSDPGSGSRRAT